MGVGSVILNVLGLSSYVAEADTFITASKDAVELIGAAKELLNSEDGQKFREKVETLIAVTKREPDGSIHIGADPAPEADQPPAKGQYVWDSLQGWVWQPED